MSELPVPIQVIFRALNDWWADWVHMVVVNLVWALCWLTIVLGPPATLGLYHVTNELARGHSLGLEGLLEGGRHYFWKSWQWALLNLLAAAIVVINVRFYAQFDATWAELLRALLWFVGLTWLIVQFYALPYLMEQETKSLRMALRNGLFTALAAPGYTMVVAGVGALIAALSIGTVVMIFLGGPCLVAVLGNHAVRERLETYRVREREAGES